MILVKNIEKKISSLVILSNVNMFIKSSEVVGIFGRNGSGKTTLFSILSGIISPDKGFIYLEDEDITSYSLSKRFSVGISYLPQESTLFRHLTVHENMVMALEGLLFSNSLLSARLKKKDEYYVAIDIALKKMGLFELQKRKAFVLSGGEKRRLEIARILLGNMVLGNSKYIFLDEPFAGIDADAMRSLALLIRSLAYEHGLGVLLTDHAKDFCIPICERYYVLERGTLTSCF